MGIMSELFFFHMLICDIVILQIPRSYTTNRRTVGYILLSVLFRYASVNCHNHKHQGLDPLIRSVSRVTTVLAKISSVFQLFSFLVVCSGMISKGFVFVAFFVCVKASSVCIRLSYLVRM